jgi:hypothetical protein
MNFHFCPYIAERSGSWTAHCGSSLGRVLRSSPPDLLLAFLTDLRRKNELSGELQIVRTFDGWHSLLLMHVI